MVAGVEHVTYRVCVLECGRAALKDVEGKLGILALFRSGFSHPSVCFFECGQKFTEFNTSLFANRGREFVSLTRLAYLKA